MERDEKTLSEDRWDNKKKYPLDDYYRASESEGEGSPTNTQPEELKRWPEPYTSQEQNPLCRLTNKLLLFMFLFLDIRDILSLTAVCRYLNSVRVSNTYLTAANLRRWFPLSSERPALARGYIIETIHKEAFTKQQEKPMRNVIMLGHCATGLITVLKPRSEVKYFSQVCEKLYISHMANDRLIVDFTWEFESTILSLSAGSGEIAVLSKNAVELLTFPWEDLFAFNIHSCKYTLAEEVQEGTVILFSQYGMVAVVAGHFLCLLTDKLRPLAKFRESSWPFVDIRCMKVHESLPYLAIATPRNILVYDVTKLDRITSVFSFSTPPLCSYKFSFLLTSSESKSKCFLILHNSLRSSGGEVIVNNTRLCQVCGDSTIIRQHLLVFDSPSMLIRHYTFNTSGPTLLRSVNIREKLFDVHLICSEERCILIGRKEGTVNSYKMEFFDYKGWRYTQFQLKDWMPEKIFAFAGSLELAGRSINTEEKVLLHFDLYRSGRGNLEVKKAVDKFILEKTFSKRDAEAAAKAKEEEFKKKRAERKLELASKRERDQLKKTSFWKSSRRSTFNPLTDCLDDFSLI